MLDATPPDWVTALTILSGIVMVLLLARGLWRGRPKPRDRDGPGPR